MKNIIAVNQIMGIIRRLSLEDLYAIIEGVEVEIWLKENSIKEGESE